MEYNSKIKTSKSISKNFQYSLQVVIRNSKILLLMITLSSVLLVSCGDDDEVPVNEESIVPSFTQDRPNERRGCIEISSREVLIETWDDGNLIDGDIISLIVNEGSGNEETILERHELQGPSNKRSLSHDFTANGFNYITLFAHNVGTSFPNTAAISLNGDQINLSSTLETNGSYDIVVTGFGVDCSDSF